MLCCIYPKCKTHAIITTSMGDVKENVIGICPEILQNKTQILQDKNTRVIQLVIRKILQKFFNITKFSY